MLKKIVSVFETETPMQCFSIYINTMSLIKKKKETIKQVNDKQIKHLSSSNHSLASLRMRVVKNKSAPTTNGNITVLETNKEIV